MCNEGGIIFEILILNIGASRASLQVLLTVVCEFFVFCNCLWYIAFILIFLMVRCANDEVLEFNSPLLDLLKTEGWAVTAHTHLQ